MKILHIITSLKIGGAESALCNFLEYEKKHGCAEHVHEVVYFHSGQNVARLEVLGIPLYYLRGFFSCYDPLAIYRLLMLIKKIKPDVIHSALWSANFFARFIAWWYRILLISDLHSDCQYHGKLRNLLERVMLSVPQKFVAVSFSAYDSFTKQFSHEKTIRQRTCMIKNGIDTDLLQKKAAKKILKKEDLGWKDTDFVVGTVGRLHAIKRYDFLIQAFFHFVNMGYDSARKPKLCLVGDGPERIHLEKLVSDLSLKDYVLFVGAQAEPYLYYPLFDCFVLSSQSEGLSISLLEAMSFGLPIVTTHQGEKHDVITDGINGFLIDINKENDFAKAIAALYTDVTIRARMKKENIAHVQSQFHIGAVARQYNALYKKLVDAN